MQQISSNPTFQLLLQTTEQTVQELGCKKTTLQEIINRTGLSKGAIYHYVKSKNELFGLVLQHRSEQLNESFDEAVARASGPDLASPLKVLIDNMGRFLLDEQEVNNKIFFYLISQQENPEVKQILSRLHDRSIAMSVRWIQIGQQHGAIPPELDAEKTAKLLRIYINGLRLDRLVAASPEKPDLQALFTMFYDTLKY
ncbi:TetR/AcrR family transcriptional regulator [Brevibacillus fluminis]|uniref:TetR/AcrR family transcriptional regulator n=1 Tax=Brevibacillus fluminis TaxID=511487 RepID=UPI003F8B8409